MKLQLYFIFTFNNLYDKIAFFETVTLGPLVKIPFVTITNQYYREKNSAQALHIKSRLCILQLKKHVCPPKLIGLILIVGPISVMIVHIFPKESKITRNWWKKYFLKTSKKVWRRITSMKNQKWKTEKIDFWRFYDLSFS